MSDVNLLEETIEILKRNNKLESMIEFVTDGKWSCPWDVFSKRAKEINYDDGYGGNEIYLGLKVVGKDWWLERGEYDGSEWWEFKTPPSMPEPNDIRILE